MDREGEGRVKRGEGPGRRAGPVSIEPNRKANNGRRKITKQDRRKDERRGASVSSAAGGSAEAAKRSSRGGRVVPDGEEAAVGIDLVHVIYRN